MGIVGVWVSGLQDDKGWCVRWSGQDGGGDGKDGKVIDSRVGSKKGWGLVIEGGEKDDMDGMSENVGKGNNAVLI